MKNIIFYLSFVVATLVSSLTFAETETKEFSDAELAQMLAPIALFPDSLLTHILIASTYPIEIVEAHRWSKKNDGLNDEQKKKLIASYDWDPSVKALIPFERVLNQLSEDLSWTQALGDAFLQNESQLLSSIQTLRKQAKVAGSLKEMKNMDIHHEDNNIVILPREKEIVYVPIYDSRVVYGSWFWAGYPPVYWNTHRYNTVNHHRPFHWNTGVHITFNYFFSAFHWHNRHVVVVAPHRTHYRHYAQRPRRLISHGGYAKRWFHKPAHRKGVAYRSKKVSKKYHNKYIKARSHNKKGSSQSSMSHRKVKQRLFASHHSMKKAKHNVNKSVKHTKIVSRAAKKTPRLAHKTHRVKKQKIKPSYAVREPIKKHKNRAVQRDISTKTKQRQQSYRVAKSSSHKGSSLKSHRSQITKNRH